MAQDWFSANAPKAQPEQGGDWFASNAPKADFTTSNEKDATGAAVVRPREDLQQFGPMQGLMRDQANQGARGQGRGILKGAANTAVNLGEAVTKIPGVEWALDTAYGTPGLTKNSFEWAKRELAPVDDAEREGVFVENMAEYMIPAGAAEKLGATVAAKAAPLLGRAAPVVANAATQSATTAAVAKAQGGDPVKAAVLGAAAPLAGAAAVKGADKLASLSERMVQAAIKPTVAALNKIAGGRGVGLDAKAKSLVRFIIDNRLMTPEKAQAMIQEAERELSRVLRTQNAPTDAPSRAIRYLQALERSAAKQGLGADDVGQLRNAAAELLNGPMGRDVVTMAPAPHPTLVGANGQPIMVLVPQTTRQLRPDMMADEALESARASSRWSTRQKWGDQKGTAIEAKKAAERAQRDAVKDAVPEAKTQLGIESRAIKAKEVLERMQQRTANRDALALGPSVMAPIEVASGNVPVMAIAAQWLRNNQMKAGIWADRMAKAIRSNDVQEAAAILKRLGVPMAATTPATVP